MKVKRFSFILVFLLILNTLAAPLAFAKDKHDPKPKLTIVALGDSITFGYPQPSTTAFPDLITGAKEVVKVGESGATSSELLAVINSNPKKFKTLIKKADAITINIGSNDLMQATGLATLFANLQPLVPNLEVNLANGELAKVVAENPLTSLTEQQVTGYATNLVKMIETIRKHTDAPIILYNLYNPIVLGTNPILDGLFLGRLHTFVEGNLTVVNGVIQQAGNITGAHVVDSYSAFIVNPVVKIIPFDIHPTQAGHKALAELADSVITNYEKIKK
ncbi:lysophospholipase L1-like esterase [Neobacillus niacini]|uniref:SGNH/GDSL hydrolase family protein n=1 Tax=Neobacillus niacini TaxID=86668 RepID=UPI00286070D6|nr:GDSL-type esterase/lipase family protein [Neobacillus niacini]MDR7080660.1 lysophospholipase L1-like esterase [Neobacillus niacini]